MDKEFFAKLPASLAKDGHLVKIGKGLPVYIYLTIIADWKTGIARVKVATITKNTGLKDRAVRGWLHDLDRAGYISAKRSDHHMKVSILKLPVVRQKIAGQDRQKIADQDRQKIASSPAENCRTPNRKVFRESFSRPFIVEMGGRTHPNPTTETFLKFAFKSFFSINRFNLNLDPRDAKTIDHHFNRMVGESPGKAGRSNNNYQILCVSWVLFQKDTENHYLKTAPRTIGLFFKANTLNDFFRQAKTVIDRRAARNLSNGKAPSNAGALLEAQEVQPDPLGQRYWLRCLEGIQSRVLPENFEKYLEIVFCISLTPEKIVLAVPNKLYCKILQENFLTDIWEGMQTVTKSKRVIEFYPLDTRRQTVGIPKPEGKNHVLTK